MFGGASKIAQFTIRDSESISTPFLAERHEKSLFRLFRERRTESQRWEKVYDEPMLEDDYNDSQLAH